MKKLSKLEPFKLRSQTDNIKHTLNWLYSTGFCYKDFSPSNIIKDESGCIILIDLSFAGWLGSAVPLFFPSWLYTNGIYSINSNLEAFSRYTVLI
jgi:serine/threonine protein kinase